MSGFMDKLMTDVDMIWVVPKLKDPEYSPGESIEVIIFGETYIYSGVIVDHYLAPVGRVGRVRQTSECSHLPSISDQAIWVSQGSW